jgi:hypothetical protein
MQVQPRQQHLGVRIGFRIDEFIRISIPHKKLLRSRGIGVVPVTNHDDTALGVLDKPGASPDPNINEDVSYVQLRPHQPSEILRSDAQNPAPLNSSTTEKHLSATQQIQFSRELSRGQSRHSVECPIAPVLAQFNHSVDYDKEIGTSSTAHKQKRTRSNCFYLTISEDSLHHASRERRWSDAMRMGASDPAW